MATSSSPSLFIVAQATAIGAVFPIAMLLELALFRTSLLYAVGCSMAARLGYLFVALAPVMVAHILSTVSLVRHYTQTILIDSTIQLLDRLYHSAPQIFFQTAPKFALTFVYRIPDHLHLLFVRLPKQVAVDIVPELVKECLCFAGLVTICMMASQSFLESESDPDTTSSQGPVLLSMGTGRVEPDPGSCADIESDSPPGAARSPPKKKNSRGHRSRKTSQHTMPPEHVSSSEAGISEDAPIRFTQLPPTPSSSPTRMTTFRRSSPTLSRQRRTSQPQQSRPTLAEEKVPSVRKPSLPTPPPTPSAALMPKTPTAPISRLIRSRTEPTSAPNLRPTRLSAVVQERYSPAVPLSSAQIVGGRRRSGTSGGRSRRGSFLHSASAPAAAIGYESQSDSTDSLPLTASPETSASMPSASQPESSAAEPKETEVAVAKKTDVSPAAPDETETPPTPAEDGHTRNSPEREGSPPEDSAQPPSRQQPTATRLKASHMRIHKPRRRESVSSSSAPFKTTNVSVKAKLPDSRVVRRRAELIFRRKMTDNMALDSQAELALSEEGEPMEIGTPRINALPFLVIPTPVALVPRARCISLTSLPSSDGGASSSDETETDTDIRMAMSAAFPPSPSVSPTVSPTASPVSSASPLSASIHDIDMLDRFSPHPDAEQPSSTTSSPLSSAPPSPFIVVSSPKGKTVKKGDATGPKNPRTPSSMPRRASTPDSDDERTSTSFKRKGKGKAPVTVFDESDDDSSPAVSRRTSPRKIPPLPAMSSPIRPTAELLEQIRMEVERTKDIPLPVDDSDLGEEEEEEEEGEIREDTLSSENKERSDDDCQRDADDEDAQCLSDSQRTASRHSTPMFHHRRRSSTPLSSPLRTPSPPCGRMLFRRRRGYSLPTTMEFSPSILGKRPREESEDDDNDDAPVPPARKRRCWSEEI